MSPTPAVVLIVLFFAAFGVSIAYAKFRAWLDKVREREFERGAEHIKRQVRPYVANCSLSAHTKAMALLKPRGWRAEQ